MAVIFKTGRGREPMAAPATVLLTDAIRRSGCKEARDFPADETSARVLRLDTAKTAAPSWCGKRGESTRILCQRVLASGKGQTRGSICATAASRPKPAPPRIGQGVIGNLIMDKGLHLFLCGPHLVD